MREYMGNLVGKEAIITESPNSRLIGLHGTIIDETRNTISIKDGRRTRVVPKQLCELNIGSDKNPVNIHGRAICFRQEDRIKEYRKIMKEISRVGVK
ncbi:MAG: ribonuclease P protein subunit [Thermoplasmataceae archaeon]